MSTSTSNLSALTEAYRSLLGSISVTTTSDDLLIQNIDNVETQVQVDGKPVALPTEKIVTNYSDSMVVFHPLCENILLGESPVLHELRNLIMEFLNDLIIKTIDSIICIAVDEELVSNLQPTQLEFIRCAAGCDATTLKNWRAISRRADTRNSANRIVTIFLKRGAIHGGVKRKRVANVHFNMYTELEQGKNTIFDAKIRKVDCKVYASILEAIFKNIDDDEYYSDSSDSLMAPYMLALIGAYYKVLKHLNVVTWNLRKPIELSTTRKLHVDDEFMDNFKDAGIYRDVLPTMPYNDGDRNKKRDEQDTTYPIPATTSQIMNSMAQQATPFHNQNITVDTRPQPQVPEPVQVPKYNVQAPPVHNSGYINTAHGINKFPTLEEQLAGMPLSGFQQQPNMNPYAQQPNMNPYSQQPNMNPYAQQPNMNPYAQQPNMNPYSQQPNMNPYAQQPNMNPYAQQPNMNPYAQQPNMNPYGYR